MFGTKMSARDQVPPLIITFLVVDIIAVGLRVWIRTYIKKSFGYDDCALCVALVRIWFTIKGRGGKTNGSRMTFNLTDMSYHECSSASSCSPY